MASQGRTTNEKDRGRDHQRLNALVVGRLEGFGRAPYQFRPQESESYYMKILTQRGERLLWGKDLERALAASVTQPKVGDQIGARRVGREAVTIIARERDAEGRVVRQNEQLAHRQRWVVEKVRFFSERSKLAHRVRDAQADVRETVRSHPELMSTFLSLRGAQELAERRIVDPQDRQRFLALVREAMVGSIQNGEPLPAVKLKTPERPAARSPSAKAAERSEDLTRG